MTMSLNLEEVLGGISFHLNLQRVEKTVNHNKRLGEYEKRHFFATIYPIETDRKCMPTFSNDYMPLHTFKK